MILHLDMDAFFASVEQMDNPELRGKPVIIGGQTRGVVATASYEARVFGIHSAMPMATARKLCPNGIFIRGRGRRYSEISASIMQGLTTWSPVVQAASIDEAYLDVKDSLNLYKTPEALCQAIKQDVARITGGLTCSIGLAPVKFLAKICSDINKPDGVFVLLPEKMDDFLLSLPIERLPGVGKRMSASLHSFGISTVAQLRKLSRNFLEQRYGKFGIALHDKSHGIDPRTVHENLPAKSESAERTFEQDVIDKERLYATLLAQAEKVGERLRKHGQAGRTITLKIKFSDFRQITRSRTLPAQTNLTSLIYETGCELLALEPLHKPVRLIGLGVSGFEFRASQLPLPGIATEISNFKNTEKYSDIDKTLDSICSRFGKGAVQRATTLLALEMDSEIIKNKDVPENRDILPT